MGKYSWNYGGWQCEDAVHLQIRSDWRKKPLDSLFRSAQVVILLFVPLVLEMRQSLNCKTIFIAQLLRVSAGSYLCSNENRTTQNSHVVAEVEIQKGWGWLFRGWLGKKGCTSQGGV
jgi:hypothetical protein